MRSADARSPGQAMLKIRRWRDDATDVDGKAGADESIEAAPVGASDVGSGVGSGGGASVADLAPSGLAVVDAGGTIRRANEPLFAVLGRSRRQVIGRSVLEFVHDDDVGFALDLMVDGGRRHGVVTGPVHIRCVDATGRTKVVQVWSRNCLGTEGVRGFVLTVLEESTAPGLAGAVGAAISAGPVDDALAHVVRAVAARPFDSAATVLVVRSGELTPVGAWPLGSTSVLDDRIDEQHRAPWHVARRSRSAVDVESPAEMPSWLEAACAARDIAAIWCRPVVTRDREVTGVVVVWRSRPGRPTVNQARHLDDVVTATTVVLDQAAYRCSMERAAFTDALTGLGNRSRLEQLLGGPDDDVTGVLYVDLDDFTAVNERYGHAAGDEVLVAVADRLRNALRSRDEILRVGGDEFVVICRAPGSPGGIDVVADRVVGVLSGPYHVPSAPEPVQVSASIGVDSSRPGLRLQQRVDWADEAMYSAKTFGNTWLRRAESSGIDHGG